MNLRKVFDDNEYWLRWVRWVLFPMLGVLAAIWIAAADAYKKVDKIPQLIEQVERLSKDVQALGSGLREDLKKAEQRQGSELVSHAQEERSAREAIGSSLKTVQAELISLKAQRDGKIDGKDVRRLISKVEEVTASEAASFSAVTSLSGKPQIPSAFLKGRATKPEFLAYAKDTHAIAQSLTILMFAKGGTWEATGTGLKVRYAGGEATFSAKPTATKLDLTRQADLFNSLSHAAESVGGPWIIPQPPSNSPRGVLQIPGGVIKPAPAPEMRAPSISDKIRN